VKIVTPPLIINDKDGFKEDIFERKAYGEALLNLVVHSSDELVISFDGQWGEGKTTFVKMWQGLLNDADIANIYVDAFANDYIDDAFIAVASAITSYAEKNRTSSNDRNISIFKDKAKNVGVQLFSLSAKLGLKVATLGVLSNSDIEELKEIKIDVAKDISEAASKFIEERLNSHAKNIELLQSFKQSLSELSANLAKKEGGQKKPLVIIIDELDRCKPTYAIEIIEKIKHLFSVKNVVFVLVMNKKQLEEAVRCTYGRNIDAHAYLQKFINLETTIPKRISEDNHYPNDIKIYCGKLIKLHEMEAYGEKLRIPVADLATLFNLSLRKIERTFTSIALFYALSSENDLKLPQIISFLAAVEVEFPDLYKGLLHRKVAFGEICRITRLSDDENNKLLKYLLLPEFEFNSLNSADREQYRHYATGLSQHAIPRQAVIPFLIKKMDMFNIADPYL
jgi:hypothetical protein